MKAQGSVRVLNLILLAGVATLPACVQPRTTGAIAHQEVEADEAVTAERLFVLGQQVESLTKYASQMEQLYAAQEAEILALRREVAGLRGQPNN
jgi:hypothetical protein